MGFIDFYRRIVTERWTFLTARFPAFAAIGKGTAPGHAPVIVQRPDEGDIRFMRLYFLAKGDHLFQIQPVAVQHMKMQYQRAGSAGYRTVQLVEIAKHVAVRETKQRNVRRRRQTWRMFDNLRVILVADAFLTAFAIAVDKTR